jgi:class 3 adenylate cyclase
MKRPLLVLFFFLLALPMVQADGVVTEDDFARKLSLCKDDPCRVDVNLEAAESWSKGASANLDKALAYAHAGVGIAERIKYNTGMAYGYALLARIYKEKKDLKNYAKYGKLALQYRIVGTVQGRNETAPGQPAPGQPAAPVAGTPSNPDNTRLDELERRNQMTQEELERQRLAMEEQRATLQLSQQEIAALSSGKLMSELELLAKDSLLQVKDTLLSMAQMVAITAAAENRALAKENELKDLSIEKQKEENRLYSIIAVLGLLISWVLLFMYFNYRKHAKRLAKEKERSDNLLLNILPVEVATELKNTGKAVARKFENVTVMFTDFRNFSVISQDMTPEELVAEIDTCFSEFDGIVARYGLEKIKTIGDAYMCAGGMPIESTDHALKVVDAALDIRDFVKRHSREREEKGLQSFEIRIGVHTGPLVAGIVGRTKFAYDIWGDTVNIASRMESSGEPGKVNVSAFTANLIKEYFQLENRGKIPVKKLGEMEQYFAERK